MAKPSAIFEYSGVGCNEERARERFSVPQKYLLSSLELSTSPGRS
jgi:hypothetical protein